MTTQYFSHIQEDLQQHSQVESRNVSEMTEDERNFYYFKLHDSDNNDGLDGLELLQAATHHSVHIGNNLENEDNTNEIGHIIGNFNFFHF